jgi:hypothetical protein
MPNRLKPRLKLRIPVGRPTRFHSTRKGKKGYDRRQARQELVLLRRKG